jgi:3-oxoacyl-[acyl-carrier-protein] synthase-3
VHDIAITGIGSYLPRLMHTNETLPPLDGEVTEEQLARIGVVRRGWAGEGESIPEMAARASERALERADTRAEDLDVIVLANWTQRRYIPEFGPKLQSLLGARKAFAFDVSTACTGFVYGLSIAHGYLQTPRFSRALVVASETTSQRGRPRSMSSLIFGDGAGAFVLERGGNGGRLIDYELASDGEQWEIMNVNEEGWVRTHIPQRELNQLAARSFADASRKILARNGMSFDDIDWIVPHSGTAGIQATLIKTLEIPPEKVLSNFSTVGNLSSAAIPVALDEYVSAGTIRKGQTILSPTTGTGWFWAALLYTV